MTRINSKQKGARGEREFRDFLKEHGYEARRTQQYCGASGDAADIVCEELGAYHFEVKRTEKINVYTALKQAIGDAKEGRVPVVAHRRNKEDWVIIMRGEDLLKLVHKP